MKNHTEKPVYLLARRTNPRAFYRDELPPKRKQILPESAYMFFDLIGHKEYSPLDSAQKPGTEIFNSHEIMSLAKAQCMVSVSPGWDVEGFE